jgi:replicative DNA helicase
MGSSSRNSGRGSTDRTAMGSVPAQHSSLERALGRQLPCTIDAERALLGALMFHDEYTERVNQVVTAQDFYITAHQLIFQVYVDLINARKRIDMVSVQDELARRDQLTAIGGSLYLLGLQEELPLPGLIEQHAQMVKEKSVLRQLISSASEIVSQCYRQDHGAIDAMLDEAERTINRIATSRSESKFVQLNIWLKKTFAHLADMKGVGRGITGLITGFRVLDEMTSGFQPGDFIVLAARPSMGKTALALGFARAAATSGSRVGFFSLEMPAEQLTLRLLSAESGIAHQAIRSANITSDDWMHLTQTAASLAETRMFIDDSAMQSILEIRAKARKLKQDQGLDLLVIDYLQLIHSTKSHENRHQEVSEISRSLKALAKELHIPIIALSQLSRAVDSRIDKRPMLSDLRESGAIEQDADLIMFLYRDVVYNQDAEDPQLAELIIGKQRNGPTGTVPLHFHNDLTLFQEKEAGYRMGG